MLQRASCLTLRRWCHSTSYLRHAAVSGLRNSSTQNSTWPLRPCFVTPSCQALVVRAHGTSTSDAQLQNEKKLTAIWEDHCRFEFETLDVDATMATMVDDPYVNHVPTMTGGTGIFIDTLTKSMSDLVGIYAQLFNLTFFPLYNKKVTTTWSVFTDTTLSVKVPSLLNWSQ